MIKVKDNNNMSSAVEMNALVKYRKLDNLINN